MSGCLEAEQGTDVNFQDVSNAAVSSLQSPIMQYRSDTDHCPGCIVIRKQLTSDG